MGCSQSALDPQTRERRAESSADIHQKLHMRRSRLLTRFFPPRRLDALVECCSSLGVPDGSLESTLLAATLQLLELKEALERRVRSGLARRAPSLQTVATSLSTFPPPDAEASL